MPVPMTSMGVRTLRLFLEKVAVVASGGALSGAVGALGIGGVGGVAGAGGVGGVKV